MRQHGDRRGHAAFDYGCAAAHLVVPAALRLPRRSRVFLAALGGVQGLLAALSDHPATVAPVLDWRTHRRIEHWALPVYFLVPWLTGVLPHRRTHLYLAAHTAVLLSRHYLQRAPQD